MVNWKFHTHCIFSSRPCFFSSKYPQPLLRYYVVYLKLDIEALASIPYGLKIDTLLLGHPLVVTTPPADEHASLNGVEVTEWNLFHDRGLIIHGTDNMIDPAFQMLIYPWLDVKNEVHAEVSSGFSWVIKELTENQFPLLAMVVLGLDLQVLSFSHCKDKKMSMSVYSRRRKRRLRR
ncbi:hypothetical protein FEM48_Zijuj01G0247100 [Ziziphus jujuba var. spinosa]|uniref:Uncharacterized protein n=1 Tax=Ziziphus jujuba var. spinosa TaxID=714518 RepID=A0A978W4I9_ZIZJJ|nr:hypothetical protein FEM48_Zijuj01G0247100 [Ziziphus jujuba var. spinosa]